MADALKTARPSIWCSRAPQTSAIVRCAMCCDTWIYLTQRELVLRWKVSGRTLERWRAHRYGPAWIVIGGSIRYRMADVLAFELENHHGTLTSTAKARTEE